MSVIGKLKCGSCRETVWGMDEVVFTDWSTVIHAKCFPYHQLNEVEIDRGRFFEIVEKYF